MTSLERSKLLKACTWVHDVIEGTPYFPTLDLLNEHKLDYILHGNDIIYNENGVSVYTPFEEQGRFK